MKDFTAQRAAYNVLKKVFCDRAYSSIELDRALETAPGQYRARITAIVYGVLEKSVFLDYVLASLAKNKVKNNVGVLLKMGLYELLFGNDPAYAVADRYVSFARDRLRGTEGFINAVLRHAGEVSVPSGDDPHSLSVRFSQPQWLVESLLSAYGRDKTLSVMNADRINATHIRRNTAKISEEKFDEILTKTDNDGAIVRTNMGYYVTHSTLKSLDPRIFTPQSLASMYAVHIYAEDFKGRSPAVLDLCAAPGGKAVYFKELVPEASVTACDVHEHRVGLIRSYAARMGADIKTQISDATVFREEFAGRFDAVVCDVPCTGSGLLISSPDILLFKTADDVRSLSALQSRILAIAARYVKPGGELLYSTCSILPAENDRVVGRFLAEETGFEPLTTSLPYGRSANGRTELFPDTDGCDGFFVAKLRRKP